MLCELFVVRKDEHTVPPSADPRRQKRTIESLTDTPMGVAPLRKERGMLQRAGKPPRFALECLARIGFESSVRKSGRESDKEQNHEHLDQRESGAPLPSG